MNFEQREQRLAENMRTLTQRHSSLKEIQIRARADEERLISEKEKHEEQAEKLCGTRDVQEIRRIYEEKLTADEKMVEGYLKLFTALEETLKNIREGIAQS